MSDVERLKVLFVAGFGPLVRSADDSRRFYLETLKLPLAPLPGGDPDYLNSEGLDGVKHFALWPLAHAAQSCFGTEVWPDSVPRPDSWLEFEVEDVAAATAVLKARGCRLLVENKREPWGQTVTRVLSPENILVAVTFTPWLRAGS